MVLPDPGLTVPRISSSGSRIFFFDTEADRHDLGQGIGPHVVAHTHLEITWIAETVVVDHLVLVVEDIPESVTKRFTGTAVEQPDIHEIGPEYVAQCIHKGIIKVYVLIRIQDGVSQIEIKVVG